MAWERREGWEEHTQVGLEKKKVTILGIFALLLFYAGFLFCAMDSVREWIGMEPLASRLILDLPGRDATRGQGGFWCL